MGQLATTMNQLQSTSSGHLSQTIANPKGNMSIISLRSPKLKQVNAESKSEADSIVQQLARAIPLPSPTRTVLAKKSKLDEELLQTFRKVEIDILLIEAIKQIPKYAKFLKELCIH
ncbi:hypothetical protein CR513_36574, partial [Mucuna pruriens]